MVAAVSVAFSAIVTSFATEATRNWLPALVSYSWSVATRSKITYVDVAFGSPPHAIYQANVMAYEPATNTTYQSTKTDQSGLAVLKNVSPSHFFVSVSFAADGKRISGQRHITIAKYPKWVVFKGNSADIFSGMTTDDIVWSANDIRLGAYNIVAAPAPTVSPVARPDDPPWLAIALNELGVYEFPGEASNPRIVEYHAATTLNQNPGQLTDKTPWGCSFITWALARANVPDDVKTARCADLLKVGEKISDAKRDAIAVFWPTIAEARSGFAGFVLGEDKTSVTVVAGNIRNSVTVASFPKASVRGYRWPQ